MARSGKFTPQKQKLFIKTLSETGNVTRSAKFCNISHKTVYQLKDRNKQFAKAWENAIDQATDELEAEARRRAFEGVDEPVFYKGAMAGLIRKYSDTLLIFLLKGHRPEKYAGLDKLQFEGGDKPITVKIVKFCEKKANDG